MPFCLSARIKIVLVPISSEHVSGFQNMWRLVLVALERFEYLVARNLIKVVQVVEDALLLVLLVLCLSLLLLLALSSLHLHEDLTLLFLLLLLPLFFCRLNCCGCMQLFFDLRLHMRGHVVR